MCLKKILDDRRLIDDTALLVYKALAPSIRCHLEGLPDKDKKVVVMLQKQLDMLTSTMNIPKQPESEKGYWVKVSNIPANVDRVKIVQLFHQIGEVLNNIEIVNGECYIQYLCLSSALRACKLNNRCIKNSESALSVVMMQ